MTLLQEKLPWNDKNVIKFHRAMKIMSDLYPKLPRFTTRKFRGSKSSHNNLSKMFIWRSFEIRCVNFFLRLPKENLQSKYFDRKEKSFNPNGMESESPTS